VQVDDRPIRGDDAGREIDERLYVVVVERTDDVIEDLQALVDLELAAMRVERMLELRYSQGLDRAGGIRRRGMIYSSGRCPARWLA
jgi:hypothetical protein